MICKICISIFRHLGWPVGWVTYEQHDFHKGIGKEGNGTLCAGARRIEWSERKGEWEMARKKNEKAPPGVGRWTTRGCERQAKLLSAVLLENLPYAYTVKPLSSTVTQTREEKMVLPAVVPSPYRYFRAGKFYVSYNFQSVLWRTHSPGRAVRMGCSVRKGARIPCGQEGYSVVGCVFPKRRTGERRRTSRKSPRPLRNV